MTKSRAFWICAAVTGINALTSAAFSLAGVLSQSQFDIYVMYAAARSLPLAAIVLFLAAKRSEIGIAVLAVTMGLVQACDAVVGILAHDVGKTVGPAVLAVATLGCAYNLLRLVSVSTPGTRAL